MAKEIVKEFVGERPSPESEDNKWWLRPKGLVYQSVIPYIKRLRQAQSYRRLQNVRFAKLYQNQNLYGVNNYMQSSLEAANVTNSAMAYNVIKAATDTAVAKLSKQRPRPIFLTEKGNSKQQRRAKLLTQYMDGVFDDMDIYAKGAEAIRDAAVINLGGLKFYSCEDTGKIKCERVITDEIMVDDNEGMYADPGQLHQIKYVFKDVLAAQYPEYKSQIEAAAPAFDATARDPENREMIIVVESWKKRSTVNSTDGRHSISIETATLMDEPYTKEYFPFVFFRWTNRLTGFWGIGIAEELYGKQLEINKLLRTVQLAQHYMAVPRVLMSAATKANTNHFNNQVGSIVKYSGPKPEFVTAQAMSSEIYSYIQWLIQSSFEQVGISQLSAQSRKPAGLESGVALREFQDIETERFANVAQSYERMYLKAAEIVIDMSQELFTKKGGAVNFCGKDFIKEVKWKDVSMDKDKYVMRTYPTNILPTTPAAKLQKAVELFQAGIIQREDFARLVDFPDLKQVMSPIVASDELIIKNLDDIVEDGKYTPPEPALNLDRAQQLSQLRYLEEKRNGLDSDRLEMLQKWFQQAKELVPAAPPPAAPMADPMAQPEALPVSPMVPQVPIA